MNETKDKTKTTPQYWKKVFKHIEDGGYSMSGLTREQIVKIIDLMRTTKTAWGYKRKFEEMHGVPSPDLDLVLTMLRQVSPRTALVLFTLAWNWNSNLTGAPQTREQKIIKWMSIVFPPAGMSPTLKLAIQHPIPTYAWYADDTIHIV